MRTGVTALALLAVLANSEIITLVMLILGVLAFGAKAWGEHERRFE